MKDLAIAREKLGHGAMNKKFSISHHDQIPHFGSNLVFCLGFLCKGAQDGSWTCIGTRDGSEGVQEQVLCHFLTDLLQ